MNRLRIAAEIDEALQNAATRLELPRKNVALRSHPEGWHAQVINVLAEIVRLHNSKAAGDLPPSKTAIDPITALEGLRWY